MSNQITFRHPSSWLILGCITLLQAINGTRYSIFPACSSTTQQHCHFSHVQLYNLIVASEAGKIFGFFSGAAADYLPASVILVIGLILGLVGYGGQYLYIEQKIPDMTYWQVLLLNALVGNSTCWISTYCCVLATRNFSDWHGTLVAIISSYSGLSGKIYATLAEGIQGKESTQDSRTFLLLTCLAPAAVGLAVSMVNCGLRFREYGDANLSLVTFLIAIASGIYIVIESVEPTFRHMSPRFRAVILVLVLMLPFAMALIMVIHKFTIQKFCSKAMPKVSGDYYQSTTKIVTKELEIGIDEETEVEGDAEEVVMEKNKHGSIELLMNINFWLFYLVYALGATLGTAYMINLEKISKPFSASGASFLLEISFAFAFFGRILAVMFLSYTRKKSIISNPALTLILMLPMPIAFFLLLKNNIRSFYISTGILGTCSGALNATSASTLYELFGCKNFVAKQTIFLTNIPLGILLFGCLAASNYQEEDGEGNHGIMCLGMRCYNKIFIIWGSISIIGIILSFILHRRTQKSS